MEIDPEYASLVVPTMVVCRNFIDIFNAESLWAPGVSLLDGIAYDFAEKKKFLKSVHNFENDILVTSKNIAKRYSSSKSHIQGTMNLCLNIFDSMKKVHGMGTRERLLLQIAAPVSYTHLFKRVFQVFSQKKVRLRTKGERSLVLSVPGNSEECCCSPRDTYENSAKAVSYTHLTPGTEPFL